MRIGGFVRKLTPSGAVIGPVMEVVGIYKGNVKKIIVKRPESEKCEEWVDGSYKTIPYVTLPIGKKDMDRICKGSYLGAFAHKCCPKYDKLFHRPEFQIVKFINYMDDRVAVRKVLGLKRVVKLNGTSKPDIKIRIEYDHV